MELYKAADGWNKFYKIVALTDEELEALPVVSAIAEKVSGSTFNLNGQRMSEGYKGIVIKDGKNL